MYYKTMRRRLESCGWSPTETYSTDVFPDVFHETWKNRSYIGEDYERYRVHLVCEYNKDGTPGKILEIYQGGKLCRV